MVASNGKKALYRSGNGDRAFKHIVPHAVDDFDADKAGWKVHRVYEKQRRDLLYERWLLPRLAELRGVVHLYKSFDLQKCSDHKLRERGVVNVLEFVPQV